MPSDQFQRELVALLPRLRRLGRALTRDAADADDLVQAVLERALGRRDQWSPGTRLDSWVFRIMKNTWIDETRSRARRDRVFMPEELGASVADGAAEAVQTRLEARDAAAAIGMLPDEQRLAVALVLVDGLSYREAADLLEVPMGTLTSRLVRGRQALQVQLDPQGG